MLKKSSAFQKAALMLLSFFLMVVILELGIRLHNFTILVVQEYENRQSIKQKGSFRIMCVGESMTMGQYPPFLEKILNQSNAGIKFSVIDKGMSAANTTAILSELEANLDEYQPDMVVAMMGINDEGTSVPGGAARVSKPVMLLRSFKVYELAMVFWFRLETRLKEIKSCIQRLEIPKDNLRGMKQGAFQERAAIVPEANSNGAAADQWQASTMISDPNPNSDSNWAMLGRKYKNEGSFTKAEAAFSRAIELNPKNDVAYEELSLLYRDVGKSDQAIQAVCRAVEINPNNDSAYVKLGVLYNNEGKTVDSEQALSRALEINPKNSDAYMELGWLYQNRRAYQYKFGGPEEVLKKAIELDPQQLQAYIALGRFYRNQKRLSDAERILKAALGVDPDFKFALGELAAIHSQGKNKNFFEVYAENIKDPNNKYHYAVTVNNYHKLKKVLDQRKIKLVCVQYPVQDLYLLKDILGGEIEDGIVFVDNERTFKEAILKEGYEEYFGDKRGGNFGHCTDKGNELLARNIANVIQGEVFNKK